MRFSEKDIRKAVSAKINSNSIDQANWYVVRCVLEDGYGMTVTVSIPDEKGIITKHIDVQLEISDLRDA